MDGNLYFVREGGGGVLEHLLHPLGYAIAILFTGNTMMVPDDQSKNSVLLLFCNCGPS